MSFWETKEGKIMSTLVHDHTNAIMLVESIIKGYKERQLYTDAEMLEHLDMFAKRCKKSRDAVDYAYTQFKEQYEESIKEI